MTHPSSETRNRVFVMSGLGIAILIGVFLSPFASQKPDGLDRVAEDLKFDEKAVVEHAGRKLPFFQILDGYNLRGVPTEIATPLSGLLGVLVTFGVAWGVGKLAVRGSSPSDEASPE
ncbi:PDGLE domain-containing protein [Altericista sp. CCNU0014]|uniref:PDGLE domain-containing protein n=1 Tax=Altericista sp. CCNU0014 TaxID=3082949 RepID=UPI00384B900B